jgi:HK97 family phage major capsid protein
MRLPFLVRQRLDRQILTGDGSAPNLRGFNNLSGVQTQAKGSDPTPDAIYKAMDLVRVTGRAVPNIVYMHPNDWQAIRLLRTADGIYIWGNPSEAGVERIWGVRVVQTDAQTQNTGLVGDAANFSQLFMRQDVTVEIGYTGDDFTDGRQTFRCGVRAALVGYRPAAFCQVTGI